MKTLRPYQEKAKQFCLKVPHPALFMDMRTGKSLLTIRVIKELNYHRILLVAPFSTFLDWKCELINENENFVTLEGTWEQRILNLNSNLYNSMRTWFIINKEGFQVLPEIRTINWDSVILDESTFIKNPKNQVTKFFTNNFRNVKKRMILTGTPAPESFLDLFCQLSFLDKNILPFVNYWDFRNKCFRLSGFYKYSLKKNVKPKIDKLLETNCLYIERSPLKLFKEINFMTESVKMTKNQFDAYNGLKKDYILNFNNKELDRTKFAVTTFVWLRRILSGFLKDKFKFNRKIITLFKLLKNYPDEQIIIWCIFSNEIDKIKKHLNNSEIVDGRMSRKQKESVIKNFRNQKFKYLIANPKSLQYGINLSNAETAIFYSTPISSELRQQSEVRIIGAEKPKVIDLITSKSIEEDINLCLRQKLSQSQKIYKIMKGMVL